MKCITKYKIPNKIIEKAFDIAGIGEIFEIKEISDGWYNSVFSVTTKNGLKYVLKVAPKNEARILTYEQNIMAAELDFYNIVGRNSDISIPKIYFSDFSCNIIPSPYFIMEFLDGIRLDKAKLTKCQKNRALKEKAKILVKLHKIKGEGFGYTQNKLFDNWQGAFMSMVENLIYDAAYFGKKNKVGKKLLHYIKKFSFTLKDVPCSLVNFDLHNLNLFCKTDGLSLNLSLLDLERGFYGDPIGDFVTPEIVNSIHKKKLFFEYNNQLEHKIELGKNEKIRFHLMSLYLACIMYTERFSRFKGFLKFFNPVYIAGTLAYKFLAIKSISFLKRTTATPPDML